MTSPNAEAPEDDGADRATLGPLDGSMVRLRSAMRRHPLALGVLPAFLAAYPLHDATLGWWVALAAFTAMMALAALLEHRRSVGSIGLGVTSVVGLASLSIAQRLEEPAFGLIAAVGIGLAVLYLTRRARRRTGNPEVLAWLASFALLMAPDVLVVPRAGLILLWLVVPVILFRSQSRAYSEAALDRILAFPPALLVGTFGLVAVAGAIVLALPASSTGDPVSLTDALFTSVSAVCVTGLIVLDTPNAFSFFGQVVLVVLFQLGGLGMMTFASAVGVMLGRRLGLRQEAVTAELVGGSSARQDLESRLTTILAVTFGTEAVGVAALTPLFMAHGDGWLTALWRAVFTSISAFCNAGFALQSDSLVPYATDPTVLLVVSFLIIAGGLGPAVVVLLPDLVRRRRRVLHAEIVLVATVLLILLPAGMILSLEWDGALAGLTLWEKLGNAWFQSVTLRTAGFNSIDLAQLHPATWTISLICMFIGGSPGSAAGGVKTTTVVVVLLGILASIRGLDEPVIFGRRVEARTVREALAIVALGFFFILGAVLALQLTQRIPLDVLVFEVVSAAGTVGLSTGGTGMLDDVGKVIVMMCMFAGRLGPLTLALFLVGRHRPTTREPYDVVQVG